MRVIGYAYEADTHCPACAVERFGKAVEAEDLPLEILDDEGNTVQAMFDTDEQFLVPVCRDCGEVIE